MRKLLGVLVIIAAIVGAWGYHRGWFTVQRGGSEESPNVTFGLDREKLKRDTDMTASAYESTLRACKVKLGQLEERARLATADAKVALDKQIDKLGREHDALVKKLGELKTATGAKYDQLKVEMKDGLDDLGAALDRALGTDAKK